MLAAGLLATGLSTRLGPFAAGTVLRWVGDLLLLGHARSLVVGIAPPGARARYLAAYGVSWGVATVVAPVVGTQLPVHDGPSVLWGTVTALAGGLAAVQPALTRACTRAPDPAPAPR